MQGQRAVRVDDSVTEAEVERVLGLVEAARERMTAAEAEAAQLRRVLDAVLAAVPPLAVVEDGKVVAWSAAMERHSATDARSVLGQPATRALPGWTGQDGVHVFAIVDGALRAVGDRESVLAAD